jgi:signal peptidase I
MRQKEKKKKNRGTIKSIKGLCYSYFRIFEHVLALAGFLMIVYYSTFDVSVMISDSMAPTLQGTSQENGDWILTEKITYCFRSPRRWELVAFENDSKVQVMKRVVGLQNERIALKNLKPVINGKPVEVPESLHFLKYYAFGNLHGKREEYECKNGFYLLGDNSRDSDDSRFNGSISPSKITGRPWLRIWPLSRFGFVNP